MNPCGSYAHEETRGKDCIKCHVFPHFHHGCLKMSAVASCGSVCRLFLYSMEKKSSSHSMFRKTGASQASQNRLGGYLALKRLQRFKGYNWGLYPGEPSCPRLVPPPPLYLPLPQPLSPDSTYP